jgi:hypothetical protein
VKNTLPGYNPGTLPFDSFHHHSFPFSKKRVKKIKNNFLLPGPYQRYFFFLFFSLSYRMLVYASSSLQKHERLKH